MFVCATTDRPAPLPAKEPNPCKEPTSNSIVSRFHVEFLRLSDLPYALRLGFLSSSFGWFQCMPSVSD